MVEQSDSLKTALFATAVAAIVAIVGIQVVHAQTTSLLSPLPKTTASSR